MTGDHREKEKTIGQLRKSVCYKPVYTCVINNIHMMQIFYLYIKFCVMKHKNELFLGRHNVAFRQKRQKLIAAVGRGKQDVDMITRNTTAGGAAATDTCRI
jgi:hypothetical protein